METDILEDSIVGSENEEETMTACDVLKKLQELWINEKMSPTLLPHHEELVDCMLDQLTQMNENLKRCKKNDFRLSIHKLEIDRIRYIICSYLRVRLKKIETFSHFLLDAESKRTEELASVLSPEEYKYAKEYASNLDVHLNTLATQHMPENIRSLDKATMSVKPSLESYVFLKVKKDVRGLLLEDNTGEGRFEEMDLNEDEQHLMRYDTIQHLLQNNSVCLI